MFILDWFMVEVSFSLVKRDFFWIGLIVVLLGVGFGYAYNSGLSPSVMGHSAGEVEPNNAESICADNLFLDGDGECKSASEIVEMGVSGDFKIGVGDNPLCPAGYHMISRSWTTPSCSNSGSACALYVGWSGAPPQCESCANWEACHMCSSTSWDAVYCVK
jgi:hypothetical protein